MRWRPHTDTEGRSFPLNHLHPFRFDVSLPKTEKQASVSVQVLVGFSLHCFTRKIEAGDTHGERYGDDRESRTFCRERYELSRALRPIIETLQSRTCGFAKDDNFVTVDVSSHGGTVRYGVFFNLKRWNSKGENAVLLVVQSAYGLDPSKPDPSRGKVRLNTLLGHALRGTRAKPPR